MGQRTTVTDGAPENLLSNLFLRLTNLFSFSFNKDFYGGLSTSMEALDYNDEPDAHQDITAYSILLRTKRVKASKNPL